MIIKDNITTVTKVYPSMGQPVYLVVCSDVTCTVPIEKTNTDYQAIQEWIAAGNTVIDNGGNS